MSIPIFQKDSSALTTSIMIYLYSQPKRGGRAPTTFKLEGEVTSDNMKQPAAILVLPVLCTILVIPVFYQNLPVSAILIQILVNTRWDGQAGVCFSLLSPSSPFSHSTSPFPGPYVKLTPQNYPNFLVPSLDGLQKFQFIYYILKMCILFGIGIQTNFQNSELLNLPVLLDEEYWSFQYCVFYNTSITSIAG